VGQRFGRDAHQCLFPAPADQERAHLRLLAGDMIDDVTIVESFPAMRPELPEPQPNPNDWLASATFTR
jgi:hypothetical protein